MTFLASLGICVVTLMTSPLMSNAWPPVTPQENKAFFRLEFFSGNGNPPVQSPLSPMVQHIPNSPFFSNIPCPHYQPAPQQLSHPYLPYSYHVNPFMFYNQQTPRFYSQQSPLNVQPQNVPQTQPNNKNMGAAGGPGSAKGAEGTDNLDIRQNRMLNQEDPKMTWQRIIKLINEKSGFERPSMVEMHVLPMMAFNPQGQVTTRRPASAPPQSRPQAQAQNTRPGQAPPPPPPMPPQNKAQPQAKRQQPLKPDLMGFKNIKFDNPRTILENLGFRVFEIPPFNFNSNKQQAPAAKEEPKEKLEYRSAKMETKDAGIMTDNNEGEDDNNNSKINNIPKNEEDEEKLETRSIKMDSMKINTNMNEENESDEDSLKGRLSKFSSNSDEELRKENEEENQKIVFLPNYMAM